MTEIEPIRPEVLNAADLQEIIPKLRNHPKLAEKLVHWTRLDAVNKIHSTVCDTPGAHAATRMISEALHSTVRVDNAQILDNLPQGAFITVSNHPFGAVDGIALISLIGEKRPKFKVMVNMFLNHIGALRPNFIAVDPMASTDPKKRAVSVNGIRECLSQLRNGQPLGFFPAGAMSKLDCHGNLVDRPWQDSVLQLIYRAKVPVIPIFFQGKNSKFFDIAGKIWWPLRTLLLPREVVKKFNTEIHVTIGEPISLKEQTPYRQNAETLGAFLREKTYALRK